ncbi:alpha/beta hydrolase [Salmonella enterica subsp. diarizonae]|nr:alpha/beta hydrolase [Salmonella enterica subsp. diarizonae]
MSHTFSYIKNVKLSVLLVMLAVSPYTIRCYAKPNMTPLGPNIADKGSEFYHFSVSRFDSLDGKRHYKVWIGVPDKKPPVSGFPVLYMLDGNAVMDRLSDEFLKEISKKTPPVIVAIGYQTKLPFESESRAYDYTPANKVPNSFDRYGRKGGGSDIFRLLIKNNIMSVVEKNIKVNAKKRGIWGHSYGGLFVLDSYLSSDLFTFYYSASPSLSRDNFALVNKIEKENKNLFMDKNLYVMEGDGDKTRESDNKSNILNKTISMVSILRKNNVTVKYDCYPGLTHGQMFTPSFESALLDISEKN